jgi:hypothetical protein
MGGHKGTETPLELLASVATVLDSDNFQDTTSPAQRRGFREAADQLRAALENSLGTNLTPQLLLAFYLGAAAQATASASSSPLAVALSPLLGLNHADNSPHPGVSIATAYLARDILVGERVV